MDELFTSLLVQVRPGNRSELVTTLSDLDEVEKRRDALLLPHVRLQSCRIFCELVVPRPLARNGNHLDLLRAVVGLEDVAGLRQRPGLSARGGEQSASISPRAKTPTASLRMSGYRPNSRPSLRIRCPRSPNRWGSS